LGFAVIRPKAGFTVWISLWLFIDLFALFAFMGAF